MAEKGGLTIKLNLRRSKGKGGGEALPHASVVHDLKDLRKLDKTTRRQLQKEVRLPNDSPISSVGSSADGGGQNNSSYAADENPPAPRASADLPSPPGPRASAEFPRQPKAIKVSVRVGGRARVRRKFKEAQFGDSSDEDDDEAGGDAGGARYEDEDDDAYEDEGEEVEGKDDDDDNDDDDDDDDSEDEYRRRRRRRAEKKRRKREKREKRKRKQKKVQRKTSGRSRLKAKSKEEERDPITIPKFFSIRAGAPVEVRKVNEQWRSWFWAPAIVMRVQVLGATQKLLLKIKGQAAAAAAGLGDEDSGE